MTIALIASLAGNAALMLMMLLYLLGAHLSEEKVGGTGLAKFVLLIGATTVITLSLVLGGHA